MVLHQILEVILGGAVGGDAGGHDDSDLTGGGYEGAGKFAEDRVGVHIALPRQRIAS